MRVYLAGPMRKIAQFNFPAFDAGKATLEALGHEVFNPADRDRDIAGFDPTVMTGHEDLAAMGFSLREALAADTEFISLHAEAVALLPGWQKSSGVAAEIALAHALGLPVGELASFEEDGPTETLEAPHGSSGSIPDNDLWRVVTIPVADLREATAMLGSLGKNTASLKPADDTRVSFSKGGEVRTTSTTGGEKGKKLAQLSSLDPHALTIVAEIAGFGAQKYSKLNFMRGYDWSLSYDALQRHLHAFWAGQDRDEESGMLHLGHAAWHCLAMISFLERGLGTDDRYTSTPELADLQTKALA